MYSCRNRLTFQRCLLSPSSLPWWWRKYEPLKRWSFSTRLYSATSQKTVIFILAAKRTWNFTYLKCVTILGHQLTAQLRIEPSGGLLYWGKLNWYGTSSPLPPAPSLWWLSSIVVLSTFHSHATCNCGVANHITSRIWGSHGGKYEDSYLLIALMMEAASTSETSVNFYQTTRCYTQETTIFNCITVLDYIQPYLTWYKPTVILCQVQYAFLYYCWWQN
jgi:hypothetical protein